jgi:hypothetical protein
MGCDAALLSSRLHAGPSSARLRKHWDLLQLVLLRTEGTFALSTAAGSCCCRASHHEVRQLLLEMQDYIQAAGAQKRGTAKVPDLPLWVQVELEYVV